MLHKSNNILRINWTVPRKISFFSVLQRRL